MLEIFFGVALLISGTVVATITIGNHMMLIAGIVLFVAGIMVVVRSITRTRRNKKRAEKLREKKEQLRKLRGRDPTIQDVMGSGPKVKDMAAEAGVPPTRLVEKDSLEKATRKIGEPIAALMDELVPEKKPAAKKSRPTPRK